MYACKIICRRVSPSAQPVQLEEKKKGGLPLARPRLHSMPHPQLRLFMAECLTFISFPFPRRDHVLPVTHHQKMEAAPQTPRHVRCVTYAALRRPQTHFLHRIAREVTRVMYLDMSILYKSVIRTRYMPRHLMSTRGTPFVLHAGQANSSKNLKLMFSSIRRGTFMNEVVSVLDKGWCRHGTQCTRVSTRTLFAVGYDSARHVDVCDSQKQDSLMLDASAR